MKVRVGAIVTKDDAVLLAKHRRRGLSYWVIPGGQVKEPETVPDALVREIYEESGMVVEPGSLLYVFETIDPRYGGIHTVELLFRADVATDVVAEQRRVQFGEHLDRCVFVPVSELRNLELYPEIAELLEQIAVGQALSHCSYLGNLWSETKE